MVFGLLGRGFARLGGARKPASSIPSTAILLESGDDLVTEASSPLVTES